MIAFIGGTGFDLRGPGSPFSDARDERIETRWGASHATLARLGERDVAFLHRHARPDDPTRKDVPPHRINYRANVAALAKLGATVIFASTAVGGLRRAWPPGTLVLLDDLIDFTANRSRTFFDERAIHVEVTRPYCEHARRFVLEAAAQENIALQNGGTYLCAEGPRFETGAEIRAFASWGTDVVGMTGAPEAFLAREAQISYVGVSIVTNLAAGISPTPLTHHEVLEAMQSALPTLARLFLTAARLYEDDPSAPARTATRDYVTSNFEPHSLIV